VILLRLQSRLRKLEAKLGDGSGLRPHSQPWLDHWGRLLQRIFSGDEPSEPGCIPLDVWDAIDADGATGAQNLAQMASLHRPRGAHIATDNA
jgi:hypothetical protein